MLHKQWIKAFEGEDIEKIDSLLHPEWAIDHRYDQAGAASMNAENKAEYIAHMQNNEFPHHSIKFKDLISAIEGNIIFAAFNIEFTPKNGDEKYTYPFFVYMEFKDSKVFRLSQITDRLAHFLKIGYVNFSKTEKELLADYFRKLKEEGLL